MHVVLVFNPRSGRGFAATCAPALLGALRDAGVSATNIEVGPHAPSADLAHAARNAEAIVVAGGDGTVRSAAAAAIATGAPIYHAPCGNENLFARQFGMTSEPARLIAALQRRTITHIDLAEAHWLSSSSSQPPQPTQPTSFLLMSSFGPDAGVIHRLHHSRTRATGHRAYLKPILDELAEPTLPRLTVHADGRPLIDDRRGLLVIANIPQYAFRIDPCPNADPADGLLDLTFFPAESSIEALAWLIRARFRGHMRSPHLVTARARAFSIRPALPTHVQIDGELVPPPPPNSTLEITVSRRVLPVLDAR